MPLMVHAKDNARRVVQLALLGGTLIRRPCEQCGAAMTVAHHDDYLKPLEVRWLCRSHHRRWHIANGAGLNRDVMLQSTRSVHCRLCGSADHLAWSGKGCRAPRKAAA